MSTKKLVRDNIPTLIKKNNKIPVVKTLSDKDYKVELYKKLQEEVVEFLSNDNFEELADIIEVIYAIADLQQISRSVLEDVRVKKAIERGGFTERLFLVDVKDMPSEKSDF